MHKQTIIWITVIVGTLAAALLVTTIVLAVLYGIERNKTNDQGVDNTDTCLTSYCIKAANYISDAINETIDPCENFYEFACGTWIKNARIPDDANSQNYFGILTTELKNAIVDLLSTSSTNTTNELKAVVNARQLYSSCIKDAENDTNDVNLILSLINNEFGGWPILQGSNWNSSTFNFPQLLLKLNGYSISVIFSAGTQVDDRNSTIQGIRIGQSGLGLEDRSYYFNESDITKAYKKYMLTMAQAFNSATIINETDVNDIFEFEKNIAKYHWTPSDQNARGDETVYTTFGNLTTIMNITFDFVDYIRRLYLLANVTLVDSDRMTVAELEYLRNVSLLINLTSPRTVQNYVIWRFMMAVAKYMPARFRAIKQSFDQIFQGIISQPSRKIICGGYVNDYMGLVVSKLYVQQYFDKNARNQSLEMIANIREAFIDMISQSTWMDSQSKSKAIEKARVMNSKIGYPEYFDNNITKLEVAYAEFNFSSTSSFLDNIRRMLMILAQVGLRSLREPIERTAWSFVPPTIVNAFYNPSFNDISFPAGILQTPFFNKDAPKYLNYGAIGMVIGHEITHGFDDTGGKYDKDGNKISWWTNTTVEAFKNRTTCIIEQYSNYTVTQVNEKIRGQQTQGEDIADNGGLKEAFYAYQKWSENNKNVDKKLPGLTKYSPEQLFFISFSHVWCAKMTDQYAKNQVLTDVHSPGRFRIIGATSNFVEFDRAFNCKPGQGNSRANKCTVW